MAALARLHSSEAFYGCDEPLEAAVFSGLMGILRQEREQEAQNTPAGTVDRNKKPDPNKKRENEERNVDP